MSVAWKKTAAGWEARGRGVRAATASEASLLNERDRLRVALEEKTKYAKQLALALGELLRETEALDATGPEEYYVSITGARNAMGNYKLHLAREEKP